jgi:hypothetical protein
MIYIQHTQSQSTHVCSGGVEPAKKAQIQFREISPDPIAESE